jgi:hypothetical protein
MIKMRRVSDFIVYNHLDFVAIQEDKLEEVFEGLCYCQWGN